MILPEEFQSLIDLAERARSITGVPAKPVPCLNLIACGGPGTGKWAATEAYGKELQQRGFIKNEPYKFDCGVAVSLGQMKRVLQTMLGQAAGGGMLIIDNAHKLANLTAAAGPILAGADCVIALVGERAGIEKLCRSSSALALKFPTIIDADNREPQRRQDELRQNAIDATVLQADVKVGRPLQIRKPIA